MGRTASHHRDTGRASLDWNDVVDKHRAVRANVDGERQHKRQESKSACHRDCCALRDRTHTQSRRDDDNHKHKVVHSNSLTQSTYRPLEHKLEGTSRGSERARAPRRNNKPFVGCCCLEATELSIAAKRSKRTRHEATGGAGGQRARHEARGERRGGGGAGGGRGGKKRERRATRTRHSTSHSFSCCC